MKSLRQIRNRMHRCYELALKVMLDEPGAEKFTLVHGRIFTAGHYIGHAWIDIGGGTIYDTYHDRQFTLGEYAARFRAVAERRYTRIKAARKASETRRWGPWHRSALVEPTIDGWPLVTSTRRKGQRHA